ncbi:hypothetical protein [Opitutus terrae]|uniref:Uncharacterized protein n=1 Tax=Opitutus terrae (strain DSM 11246 / JCM 15787 / PB90-1) TaxID=452637 RepID=B1ZZL6_OPITP|nr:hypothetical protein [Opitutus terrae]ACB76419.1 hypothetical protein Oter_3139 [Opitutus terrae PB90-1]
MNPDRLPELLRQRELVRTHLAWLEREIAAATATNRANASPPSPTGAPTAAASAAPTVAPTGLPPATEFAARLAAPAADLYEPDPRSAALGAKRGCFAAFALTLLLLVLVLAAVYFVAYRDRPLLFVPRDNPMTEKPAGPPPPSTPRK